MANTSPILLLYLPTLLMDIGFTDRDEIFRYNTFIGVVKTAFILFPVYFSDKLGRKVIFKISMFGQLIALVGFIYSSYKDCSVLFIISCKSIFLIIIKRFRSI